MSERVSSIKMKEASCLKRLLFALLNQASEGAFQQSTEGGIGFDPLVRKIIFCMPCDAAKTTAIINNINKERINKMSLRWPGLPSECCLGVQTALHRPDPHQLSQQLRAQCCSRGGADADAVSGQMRQVSWCPKSASRQAVSREVHGPLHQKFWAWVL